MRCRQSCVFLVSSQVWVRVSGFGFRVPRGMLSGLPVAPPIEQRSLELTRYCRERSVWLSFAVRSSSSIAAYGLHRLLQAGISPDCQVLGMIPGDEFCSECNKTVPLHVSQLPLQRSLITSSSHWHEH